MSAPRARIAFHGRSQSHPQPTERRASGTPGAPCSEGAPDARACVSGGLPSRSPCEVCAVMIFPELERFLSADDYVPLPLGWCFCPQVHVKVSSRKPGSVCSVQPAASLRGEGTCTGGERPWQGGGPFHKCTVYYFLLLLCLTWGIG